MSVVLNRLDALDCDAVIKEGRILFVNNDRFATAILRNNAVTLRRTFRVENDIGRPGPQDGQYGGHKLDRRVHAQRHDTASAKLTRCRNVLDELPQRGIAVRLLLLALNCWSIRVRLDLVSDVVRNEARRRRGSERRR